MEWWPSTEAVCSAGATVTVFDNAELTPLIGRGSQLDCSQARFAMARCCSPSYLRRGPAGASFVEAFAAAPASAFETPFASRGEAALFEGALCTLEDSVMQHAHAQEANVSGKAADVLIALNSAGLVCAAADQAASQHSTGGDVLILASE